MNSARNTADGRIEVVELAQQLAELHDTPIDVMLINLGVYIGVIQDDPALYIANNSRTPALMDGRDEWVTDRGAVLLRDRITQDYGEPGAERLAEMRALLSATPSSADSARVARQAVQAGVPIREVAALTGLSRERVHRIHAAAGGGPPDLAED